MRVFLCPIGNLVQLHRTTEMQRGDSGSRSVWLCRSASLCLPEYRPLLIGMVESHNDRVE
jgi:hypothetical protein